MNLDTLVAKFWLRHIFILWAVTIHCPNRKYDKDTKFFELHIFYSPVLASEGSKIKQVYSYGIAHEMEMLLISYPLHFESMVSRFFVFKHNC